MSGRAHILVSPDLLVRMKREPALSDAVTIRKCAPFGEGYYQLEVESSVLPPGYHGQLYLIANPGEPPRFKSDTDV